MKREVAETICSMVDDVLAKLQDFNNYINENSDAVPIERIGVPADTNYRARSPTPLAQSGLYFFTCAQPVQKPKSNST